MHKPITESQYCKYCTHYSTCERSKICSCEEYQSTLPNEGRRRRGP